MTAFYGTNGADGILRTSLTPGVTTDPDGVTGTDDTSTVYDGIFAYGGADHIVAGLGRQTIVEAGAGADVIGGRFSAGVYIIGGTGNDRMLGGAGDDTFDLDALSDPIGASGADTMRGGAGDDTYLIDSKADRVVECAGGGSADAVYSLLHRTFLPRDVEGLALVAEGPQIGIGNQHDNALFKVLGSGTLRGRGGDDTLGVAVNDAPVVLIGGAGDDIFQFADARAIRHVITRGDGASAFQGAGAAPGDRIDLSEIDGDETDFDFTNLTFGGTGPGHVSVVNCDGDSLVRANTNPDEPGFEFQLLIEDGAVKASAYTAADFILDLA